MPCSDSYSYDQIERQERDKKIKQKLDTLTRLLCAACHYIEEDGQWKESDIQELREWFDQHKRDDKQKQGT